MITVLWLSISRTKIYIFSLTTKIWILATGGKTEWPKSELHNEPGGGRSLNFRASWLSPSITPAQTGLWSGKLLENSWPGNRSGYIASNTRFYLVLFRFLLASFLLLEISWQSCSSPVSSPSPGTGRWGCDVIKGTQKLSQEMFLQHKEWRIERNNVSVEFSVTSWMCLHSSVRVWRKLFLILITSVIHDHHNISYSWSLRG